MRRQQVKAELSAGGARKQDTLVMDLDDVEGWANLEVILLAWHESKKKNVQVVINIIFVQMTAREPVQDDFTEDNELKFLKEEVVIS